MDTTATTRYQEALAHDIADALNTPRLAANATVHYDRAAETWAVRIKAGRNRYDLLMPAPAAMYGLFRNDTWLGGMNLNTDACPCTVAEVMLDRIATHA